jgi:1-aminocyclopropane-1-carboxylate deaminase
MVLPRIPSPVEQIKDVFLSKYGIEVWIKRDDLIHPEIMGNKWRKLKYNIEAYQKGRYDCLITYGGAYSNHIAATAAASRIHGIPSIGIIRGDELNQSSNPTLKKATLDGMKLIFSSRQDFRRYKENLSYPATLQVKNPYILPEGGTNHLAILGAGELVSELTETFDIICCSAGTGGTIAGILNQVPTGTKTLAFSALKGSWIKNELKELFYTHEIQVHDFDVFDDHWFGGYGKFNQTLIQFILDFRQNFGILLDPIYTGKMFFSVWELIKNRQIARNSRILMVHTGGIQGIGGFNLRNNVDLPLS